MFSATHLPPTHNKQELEVDITKVQFSLLSSLSKATDSVQTWSHDSAGGVLNLLLSSLSLSPSAMTQVIICGSQDWLAIWGRHCEMTGGPVGVWLSRQRPLTMCCRAVPLGFHFCREKIRWKNIHLSPSVSVVLFFLLRNDGYQHNRFMLVVTNGLTQTWITVITWMIDLLHSQWRNYSTASWSVRQPNIPQEKKQFVLADKMSSMSSNSYWLQPGHNEWKKQQHFSDLHFYNLNY